MQFAAAGHPEGVGVAGVVDAQGDVLQSLCRGKPRIWRLVTNLPSRPASGELLTMKFMVRVGLSTAIGVIGSMLSGSQYRVTPMFTWSMPDTSIDVAGFGGSGGAAPRPRR